MVVFGLGKDLFFKSGESVNLIEKSDLTPTKAKNGAEFPVRNSWAVFRRRFLALFVVTLFKTLFTNKFLAA